jgi:hypothetical protein
VSPLSAAAFDVTAIVPERPAAKFWFSVLWPNIDPEPCKDGECPDWNEGRIDFGIDRVDQIAPVVPMIRMKAETLEQAIPEARRQWRMGNMIAPYGRTPYGYMIHDAGRYSCEADSGSSRELIGGCLVRQLTMLQSCKPSRP